VGHGDDVQCPGSGYVPSCGFWFVFQTHPFIWHWIGGAAIVWWACLVSGGYGGAKPRTPADEAEKKVPPIAALVEVGMGS
jgi:hypothetical protein